MAFDASQLTPELRYNLAQRILAKMASGQLDPDRTLRAIVEAAGTTLDDIYVGEANLFVADMEAAKAQASAQIAQIDAQLTSMSQ